MKLNCWLILGTMLSTSLLAQPASNAPSALATNPPPPPPAAPVIETPAAAPAITNTPAEPAPAPAATTNAPTAKPAKAAKSAKKKAVAKKKKSSAKSTAKVSAKKGKVPAAELPSVPLVAGPATVVASNVNVRGQGKLNSEVVTKVTKGQEVTVLQEIVHNNSGPTEPSAWAKILLPPGGKVWVNNTFLTPDKTVKATRLKLRAGPGENYSMLGIIDHGQAVKEITTKGDWTQIEPPTNAYAFVAAVYLRQEAPGAVASNTISNTPAALAPAEPPATPDTVAANPTIAPPPASEPVPPATPAAPEMTNAPSLAANAESANTETNAPEAKTEEPPPRIVSHEGVVRGLTSIQAPSHFALISTDTGKVIDYLYTPSTDPNADLRRWKGAHVVVTGEEGLDERWGNTPVLTIQRITVVDEPAAP